VKERTDGEIPAGLIERTRLLVALADDIAVAARLETQPLVKQLEQLVAGDAPDTGRGHATHARLLGELHEWADLEALLGAMTHFLPA